MKIDKSKQFEKDIVKLSISSSKIDKTLLLFNNDSSYPSLHNKHIVCKKADNLYSLRIDDNYRILYFKLENSYRMDRCLTHAKYDRLTKNC